MNSATTKSSDSWRARVEAEAIRRGIIASKDASKNVRNDNWREWLAKNFGEIYKHPFSERHERLWSWFDSLTPGVRPEPAIEIWGRGGAKSQTAEGGVCRVGHRLTRRFGLYVSDTQELADKHVQSIAGLFDRLGVERALNRYGNSKGWRRNQLRTATGFNVEAYGLDVSTRGIKLDEYRPDLVIFDDIDSQNDSPKTVQKKIQAITGAIIPALSTDGAILFIQNLIHEEGIVAQLVDGRADFLHDRGEAHLEPAVRNLVTDKVDRGDGRKVYRIVAGEATWEGQNLATCERQINDWGLSAFLREAQHEVIGASGYFFDPKQIEYKDELPAMQKMCRAWDLAGTEGGGDYTVGVLMGLIQPGRVGIEDVKRGQYHSENVRKLLRQTALDDHKRFGKHKIRLAQDPGQAGKDQAEQLRKMLGELGIDLEVVIKPVSGPKAVRARGFADCMNGGNVVMKKADWNHSFAEEHRKFREDEEHEFDDQVDAASDAFNEMPKVINRTPPWTVKRGGYA